MLGLKPHWFSKCLYFIMLVFICLAPMTGNVDCSESEEPDIADITRLTDFLYVSHAALCCPGEADCDGSGGEPDISDLYALIDYLYGEHTPLADCP